MTHVPDKAAQWREPTEDEEGVILVLTPEGAVSAEPLFLVDEHDDTFTVVFEKRSVRDAIMIREICVIPPALCGHYGCAHIHMVPTISFNLN